MLLLPVRLREGAQHHGMAPASLEMQLVSPVSHCFYTSAGPQSTWHLPCSSSKMLSGLISLRKKAEKERQPLAQRSDRKHHQCWWHPRKAQALGCWQKHCTLRASWLIKQHHRSGSVQAAGLWVSSTPASPPTVMLESLSVIFLLFNLFQYHIEKGPPFTHYK